MPFILLIKTRFKKKVIGNNFLRKLKIFVKGGIRLALLTVEQMPKMLKRFFVIDEKVVDYRITQNGLYQARFTHGGVRIEVEAKSLTR